MQFLKESGTCQSVEAKAVEPLVVNMFRDKYIEEQKRNAGATGLGAVQRSTKVFIGRM